MGDPTATPRLDLGRSWIGFDRNLRVAPRPLGAERLHRPVARLGVGQTLRPRQRAVEVGLTPGGGDGPHRLLLGRALESQRELRGGLRVLADQFPHHRARRVTLGGALDKSMSFVIPNPGLGNKVIAIRVFLHGDGTAPLKQLHAQGVSFFAIGLKR